MKVAKIFKQSNDVRKIKANMYFHERSERKIITFMYGKYVYEKISHKQAI